MNKLDVSNVPEEEKPKNMDDFICRICAFILHDPHECENCGTPYCKDCLEAWHQRSAQCPLKCGATLKIKPAHRFLKKMLGELVVKCPTNDCPEMVNISRLDQHMKKCQFLLVKCSNQECEEYFPRKDIKNHEEICKHKELQCERCLEKIKIIKPEDENEIIVGENPINGKHDCIKLLSEKTTNLSLQIEKLVKKNENYEKEVMKLKNRTNLMMSNMSYKCDQAHPLIFKANWTSACSCCGLIKICTRWECSLCKKNYCLDCIRLLNSVFCPNLHTFIYGDRGNFLCDICGAKKTQGGSLSLHDPVCDFDLCDNCVIKLFPNISK